MEQQQEKVEILAALPIRAYVSTVELGDVGGKVYGPEPMSDDAEPLLAASDVADILKVQRELRLAVEERVAELERQVEILTCERNAWEGTAAMFLRGQEFYQAIVREIGEQFGEAAHICDDGGVSEDVLALKVPELVEGLFDDYYSLCEKQVSAPRRLLRSVRNLF